MTNSDLTADTVATLEPDELDYLLGEAVLRASFLSKPPSRSDVIGAGRATFERLLPEIRQRLCGNAVVVALLAPQHKDRNTIILGLAALIPDLSAVPLVLGARILHYGYERMCPAE